MTWCNTASVLSEKLFLPSRTSPPRCPVSPPLALDHTLWTDHFQLLTRDDLHASLMWSNVWGFDTKAEFQAEVFVLQKRTDQFLTFCLLLTECFHWHRGKRNGVHHLWWWWCCSVPGGAGREATEKGKSRTHSFYQISFNYINTRLYKHLCCYGFKKSNHKLEIFHVFAGCPACRRSCC